MGEVIRFIPKAERERIRLIEEARAMYDSVFPSSAPVIEQRGRIPAGSAVMGAAANRSDRGSRS